MYVTHIGATICTNLSRGPTLIVPRIPLFLNIYKGTCLNASDKAGARRGAVAPVFIYPHNTDSLKIAAQNAR